MRTKQILKQVGLIVWLLCNAISSYASHDNRSLFWCHPQASQNPEVAQGGAFQLRLAIEPIRDTTITEVRLEISKTFRLTYDGPTEIIRQVTSRTDSMIFELSLILPDNDTCGIECWFWATPNKGESGFSQYWITNPNKPEQYGADPRYLSDFYYDHHQSKIDYTYDKDSVDARAARIKPTTYHGYYDDTGNQISEEEWKHLRREKFGWAPDYEPPNPQAWLWIDSLGNPIPQQDWEIQQRLYTDRETEYDIKQDTMVVWIADSAGKEIPVWKPWYDQQQRLQEEEKLDAMGTVERWIYEQQKSPLVDVPFQQIIVNKQRLIRYRGETQFHPFDRDAFKQYIQSLPPGSIPDTGIVIGPQSKKKEHE